MWCEATVSGGARVCPTHPSCGRDTVARQHPGAGILRTLSHALTRCLFVRWPVTRPQVRREHPLSLSISISGGRETYQDSPSNGERTGSSPA